MRIPHFLFCGLPVEKVMVKGALYLISEEELSWSIQEARNKLWLKLHIVETTPLNINWKFYSVKSHYEIMGKALETDRMRKIWVLKSNTMRMTASGKTFVVKCPEVSTGSFPLVNCILAKYIHFRMLTPRSLMYWRHILMPSLGYMQWGWHLGKAA